MNDNVSMRHAVALALGLAVTHAEAAEFTFLTHPDLAGWVTFDPYLGNADDRQFPGINTIGGASQFIWLCCGSDDVYGFLGGSMSTRGVTPFGLREQQYFGLNQHVAQNLFGEWNSNSQFSFNNPLTQTMPAGAASSIVIAPDQTYTTSFVLYDSAVDGHLSITGQGYYELAWQNAGFHGGNEAGHFAFVRDYLPTNWQGVAHELQNWEILDGPYAGVTGFTTTTFYTTDYLGIPQTTTPSVLGAPWTVSGYAALQEDHLVVGSPDQPAMDGSATLAGGAVASLTQLSLGPQGSGTVTVEGAGTRLDLGSIVVSTFGGTASHTLNIREGGTVNTTSTYIFGIDTALEVVGEGSTLHHTPGMLGGSAFMYFDQGQAMIKEGGHLEVAAKADGGFWFFGHSHTTVEGAGSRLSISGPRDTTQPIPRMSVILIDGANLEIRDGGEVSIDSDATDMNGFWAGALSDLVFNTQASTVLVDGNGSLLDGDLLVNIGAKVQWDETLEIYTDAHAAGSASILTVQNGGVVTADGILIGHAGTLNGNGGTIIGNVENRGLVAPGASPGTLRIDGDYTQTADGRLVIELAGGEPGDYDVLEVTGTFTAGGTLEIRLLDGYVPDSDASFAFLLAGAVAGEFDDYLLPQFGNETLRLHFGSQGFTATVAPVPLPAPLLLLATALGGLAFTRKRV